MSDSIHLRNAKALAEADRSERQAREQLADRVSHLENQVAMLTHDVARLRQNMTLAFTHRGPGPTVKE